MEKEVTPRYYEGGFFPLNVSLWLIVDWIGRLFFLVNGTALGDGGANVGVWFCRSMYWVR